MAIKKSGINLGGVALAKAVADPVIEVGELERQIVETYVGEKAGEVQLALDALALAFETELAKFEKLRKKLDLNFDTKNCVSKGDMALRVSFHFSLSRQELQGKLKAEACKEYLAKVK